MTETYRIPDTYKYYHHDKNVNINSNSVDSVPSDLYDEQAIKCRQCNLAIISNFNLRTGEVTAYDYDSYIRGQKVAHEHPPDNVTKVDVTHRVAVEKRLLFKSDPHDHYYKPRSRGNQMREAPVTE
jgi:hypothetical protein